MDNLGRTLLWVGIGIALLGALLWGASALFPSFRPGRLPGDIAIEQPGFKVYVPITTMLLVSALATLLFWLAAALRR
jgi:hypothetical protein